MDMCIELCLERQLFTGVVLAVVSLLLFKAAVSMLTNFPQLSDDISFVVVVVLL